MKGKGETSRDDDRGDNIDGSPTTERPTLHSPVAGILLVDKKVLGGSQLAPHDLGILKTFDRENTTFKGFFLISSGST